MNGNAAGASPVERRVRRPRVTTLQRDEDAFQGRYKQHELDLLRSGDRADWYIRVRHPGGCYVYDGWWPESRGRTVDDAVAEACRGAGLWTPNAEVTGAPHHETNKE
jgi:hypothetical protein